MTTYKFEHTIPPTETGTIELPADLLGEEGEDALTAQRMYSNVRTLWIEPNTGVVINRQEQQNSTIAYDGTDRITTTQVNTGYDDETITFNADKYGRLGGLLNLVENVLPITFLIVGAVLLVAGFVLGRRGAKAAAASRPGHQAGSRLEAGSQCRSAAKIAVPGVSLPRMRRPATPDPVVVLGPLGLEQGGDHEAVARPAARPSRRACGGARRTTPRRSRRRPRRTASGPSTTGRGEPRLVGVVGERPAGRVGDREGEAPAGAQHACGLGDADVDVGDELERAEAREHHVERASAKGSAVAVPSTLGTTIPVSSSRRRECCSWRHDRSRPTGRPPRARTQREH